MKDYASMSDQHINRLVAAASGMGNVAYYMDDIVVLRDNRWVCFYPCNNPADAWPVIVENKLSIYPSAERWGVEGFNADDPFYFDENPLRAAMIVFLMMKERKND